LLSYASTSFAEYSRVSNTGNAIPASTALGTNADDWACTYDSSTQLIWEIKTTDGGLRDIKWNYSWFNADPALNGGFAGLANGGNCLDGNRCDTESYVRQVNAQGLCGANDWRLPTGDELVAQGFREPFFINAKNQDITKGFWSATTDYNPERAILSLPFGNAYAGTGHKGDQHGVLLVKNRQGFKPIDFKETQYRIENLTFKTPSSIKLAPDETLFVADSFNQRIVNFSQDGAEIRSFGHFNFDAQQYPPAFMAFAPDGTLYVDDSGNKRIQRFKTDGSLLSTFNKPIDSPVLDMGFTENGGFLVLSANHAQQFKADGSVSWAFKYGEPFTLPSSPYFFTRGLERAMITADGTVYLLGVGTNVGTMVTRTFSLIHLKADGTLMDETPACCANNYAGNIIFPSLDVITKAGVKFVLVKYVDHTDIQKLSPNIPEYTYVSNTGTVIFENITVGDEHYWVQLQDQGGYQFKVIKAYPIKPEVENKTSVYDAVTGWVTLPKVAAEGLYYEVILERLPNGLFSVKSLKNIAS
ncbi:MAG: DUF1566 domain-containing protein, partial [Methylococcaceae bacterium]|nr:DUF1566 domain-containing protein [Methylococcaceae bacterium]